jgi:hypothetical protein
MSGLDSLFFLYLLGQWADNRSEEEKAAHAVSKIIQHPAAEALTPAAATPALPAPAETAKPPVPVAVPPVVTTPQGPATPAAMPAPFPQAVPPTVPTFPDNWPGGQPAGWRFATPVTPEVAKRAVQLLPTLWGTGVGTHVVEMTGGQWIAYNSEWHDAAKTVKGVTAYTPKAA